MAIDGALMLADLTWTEIRRAPATA